MILIRCSPSDDFKYVFVCINIGSIYLTEESLDQLNFICARGREGEVIDGNGEGHSNIIRVETKSSFNSVNAMGVDKCVFICSLSPLVLQRYISIPNMSFMAGLGSCPVEDPAERLLNVAWSFWISMPGPGVA